MTRGQLCMTRKEMEEGFAQGRRLTQEEWAHEQEIKWLDELVAEGKATVTKFEYKANYQCAVRFATGIKQ